MNIEKSLRHPLAAENLPEIDVEDQADKLLATFPSELQRQWRTFFEESEDQQAAYVRILEIAGKRQNAIQPKSEGKTFDLKLSKEAAKRNEEWQKALIEDVGTIIERNPEPIGVGRTAKVHKRALKDGSTASYCLKIIINTKKSEYLRDNDIGTEFSFLEKLESLNVDGARISLPYACIQNQDKHVLVMENIDGVSIQDVLDDKEKLPDGFDPDVFFTKLENFIRKMHERSIHHRDLHAGNVMIDRNTLDPRVIDFGMAIKIMGDEDPYIRRDERKEKLWVYINDLVGLKENKKLLFEHLHNKNQKGGQPT
ncbi:protein kinase family protein [Candidatus Falkowbacteria bacterium]|nr:protein kinase family protein [Candidatus Falkowbacteria bacterium]